MGKKKNNRPKKDVLTRDEQRILSKIANMETLEGEKNPKAILDKLFDKKLIYAIASNPSQFSYALTNSGQQKLEDLIF